MRKYGWLIVLALVWVKPVMAAGITLEPAFQEVVVEEGQEEVVTAIRLFNQSDLTLDLELMAVDFVQTDETGAVALMDRIDSQYRLAEYLELDQTEVQIEPGGVVEVPVKVMNRADLEVGGHYGAVVVQAKPQDVVEFQQVLPGVTGLLLVHKRGGERYHLSLDLVEGLEAGVRLTVPNRLNLKFSNEGNVHLIPRGEVEIRDWFNRVVARGAINETSSWVLPGNKRNMGVNLKSYRTALPIMAYKVQVTGNSVGGQTPFGHQSVMVVVAREWLVGLGLLVVAGVIWSLVKRNKVGKGEEK